MSSAKLIKTLLPTKMTSKSQLSSRVGQIACLLFLLVFVMVSSVFASEDRSTSSPNAKQPKQANATNFCQNIDNRVRDGKSRVLDEDGKIDEMAENHRLKLQTKREKFQEERATRKESLEDNFRQHLQNLQERTVGKAEDTAAVNAFETAIKSAITTYKAALDAAHQTFRQGMDQAIATRNSALKEAITTRKAAFLAASERVKTDCAAGIEAKTIKETYQASMNTAREAYVSSIKAAQETFRAVQKSLIQAKKSAFEKAQAVFKAAVQTAQQILKSALAVP